MRAEIEARNGHISCDAVLVVKERCADALLGTDSALTYIIQLEGCLGLGGTF